MPSPRHRPIRWLLDPGPGAGAWRLVPRIAIAAIVLPAGIGKFTNHDAYVERFERWGFAAPGAMAILTGVVEILASLSILLGVLPRVGALGIVGVMIGALATAGRVDGGSNIVLPIVVIALALAVMAIGTGPLRLPSGAVDPRRHGPARSD